ncbi:MAM domain-containing glycosylphosphatidylinositol anchor protein 1-like [Branchiostoma floridae x Branchiostoma japonicum]
MSEASTSWFDFYDEKVLSGHNTERIAGINTEECARRCLVGTSTVPSGSCLSFDYDHQGGGACVLSTANKDTSGVVLSDSDPPSRFDYYHKRDSPNSCDFEANVCQYTQDTTDDFQWTRNSGWTRSYGTGPTGDHTTGSGYYMYVEASSPRQQGDIARLTSPTYLLYRGSQCLLFWTHMYGSSTGTLRVSVKAGNTTTEIWSRSGNQGNQWFSVAVSIPVTGSYQVIFEGVRGGNALGDIAIDDVSILQEACPGDTCRF